MKIGITGINGLLGKCANIKLTNSGHELFSLNELTKNNELTNKEINFPEYRSLDWVIHFASKTSIAESWENPYEIYSSNFNSTLIALKIAKYSKASFIFMSSFLYGKPKYFPIDEKHPVHSINPYMSSKIIGEELSTRICSINKIPLIILRGSNIYGDKLFPGRLISDLLISNKENKPFVINDPEPRRDYLYVKDFASLILKIVEQSPIKNGLFNVGHGENFSNLEVAELFHEITQKNTEIQSSRKKRDSDILNASMDVSLVKKTFSWNPEYSLREGLKDLLD